MSRWSHLFWSTMNGVANLIVLSWMTDWFCEGHSVSAAVSVLVWSAVTIYEVYRDLIKGPPCLAS